MKRENEEKIRECVEYLRSVGFTTAEYIETCAALSLQEHAIPEAIKTIKLPGLLPAESRVAALAGIGCRNSAIATILNICDNTVKNHMFSIFHKLQLRRRCDLEPFVWKNAPQLRDAMSRAGRSTVHPQQHCAAAGAD